MSGEPKDLIKHCIQGDPTTCYTVAKSLLDKHYGNPNRIACAYMKELNQWPVIKAGDSSSFNKFYRFLLKCQTCKDNSDYLRELDSSQVLRILQSKLPFSLQDRWNRQVADTRRKKGREVRFLDFVDMVEVETQIASDPMYSREAISEYRDKKTKDNERNKLGMYLTNVDHVDDSIGMFVSKVEDNTTNLCPRCWANHDLDNCDSYVKLSLPERNKFLYENKLCFGCYDKITDSHKAKTCKKKRKCETCNGPHPTGLHGYFRVRYSSLEAQKSLKCNSSQVSEEVISMCIVPVRIKHGNSSNEITVYALLDECSQGTFVDDEVLRKLGISGQARCTSVTVKTISGENTKDCVAVEGLIVSPVESSSKEYGTIEVNIPVAYSSACLPIDKEEVPTPQELKGWHHLNGIVDSMQEYDDNIPIGILIGANCPKALEPHEFISSCDNGPFAYRSCLGWCVVETSLVSEGTVKLIAV